MRMGEKMRGLVNAAQEAHLAQRSLPAGTHASIRSQAFSARQEAYATLERHIAALEAVERVSRAILTRVDIDVSVLANDDWLGTELRELREHVDAFARAGEAPKVVDTAA